MALTDSLEKTLGIRQPDFRGPNGWIVTLAGLLLAGGALALAESFAWRQGALYLLGGVLGVVLYHAAFGFASSWRRFLAEGRGEGLRAQLIMLALASVIFFPVLDQGSFFGRPVGGSVAPFGVSVAVGAFLFGVGMQLGGACASGTLYTVGGGSTRMVITLVFFMAGAVIGTAHLSWWLELPRQTISLRRELGLAGGLALQLGVFALLALATVLVERRRHGRLAEQDGGAPVTWRRLLQGPWPLIWGGVLLALLNVATLALAGHPWSVVFGYTLWGAKAAAALGVDVASWDFWTRPFPSKALAGSLFANTTSVMNFGIMIGALFAAGLAGRFAPGLRVGGGPALAAVIGGLLMGYGARLAFGCNIGAFFSGVASGSLHGWLWFVAALLGTYVGLRLRPFFALEPQTAGARA